MQSLLHTTWIEISRSALTHNIRMLRTCVGPQVALMATVKANAYGHGAVLAGQIFLDAGAEWLAVHALDEALELRRAGVSAPVYVLGYVPIARLSEVVAHELDIVIYDEERLVTLEHHAQHQRKPARIHLKLETGLHRQGVSEEAILGMAQLIGASPYLLFRGLTSHFANIEDTTAADFAREQFRRFEDCRARLAAQGLVPQYAHMANSAATMLYPEMHGNLVRPGIACYGLWPSATTQAAVSAKHPNLELRPAFTWKALVAQVKTLQPGDTVGYGRTFTAPKALRSAIVPVGYYEGFDRRAGHAGYVLINGAKAPVIGRVSMNNIMVDCSQCGDVKAETEVVLLGQQGTEVITAELIASWTERIAYEVPTRVGATLGASIPRIIVE